jgi:hypothetical protein
MGVPVIKEARKDHACDKPGCKEKIKAGTRYLDNGLGKKYHLVCGNAPHSNRSPDEFFNGLRQAQDNPRVLIGAYIGQCKGCDCSLMKCDRKCPSCGRKVQ